MAAAAEPAAAEKTSYIRDVYQDNLEKEFEVIREMVVNYPCISMVRGRACGAAQFLVLRGVAVI